MDTNNINYTQSYSSYPDSHDSSPRSREIDCENNNNWDDPPLSNNYKVKFMCSYGGKIHPRPHDNQLAYVGGDTKILAVDRNVRFTAVVAKLSAISDSDVCFKYQLPGEDLDALISVTNDEDLEHMMLEYDRLHRGSVKPARLRIFLFPVNSSAKTSFSADDSTKSSQQWFVDALNSVPSMDSSVVSPKENPDFLFGLEKPAVPVMKPPMDELVPVKIVADSGGELPVSPAEIQRQIHELQILQIASEQQQQQQLRDHHQQQQAMFQRNNEESLARAFQGDYYVQSQPIQVQEKLPPVTVPPIQVQQVPVTMSIPTGYWQQDRHMASSPYPPPVTTTDQQSQQQVYLIPAPGGMYSAAANNIRPVNTGQVNQGYYQMPTRMVQDVYREPAMYSMGPPQSTHQHVAYDSAGRQVYYNPAPQQLASSYQTVTAAASVVDPRQSGPLTQDTSNKVVKPSPPQASV
ncbi:hypothetical protein GIB67_003259 [Kingdonia uniflora]|uniref:PB1 domain-containing protein n=1 Tax=Kingdonia uniflora TaxID=39325 RepID=A0A7J7LXH4_9MAGN|nr:hypothetical protein GIB67_003259 [Kingdonia uniflora]